MRRPTPIILLLVLLLAGAVPARAEFHVTVVPAESWGASDAEIGVAGGVVEDFEDAVLAPGLLVSVSASDGTFAGPGQPTLPTTFNPVANDPYGDAFVIGVWDGDSCLLSTEGNISLEYGARDFRRLRLEVPAGTAWIGVSLQQLTGNDALVVNGIQLGRVQGLGLTPTPGRNGYLIVASDDPEEMVTSLTLGGAGDAFVMAHVVFADPNTVPVEPMNWGAVKALFR